MTNLILVAVVSLGAIALILAAILYMASKKFAVYEDPRIAQVGEILPQANCGGCGYPGCTGFADACVKADSLEGLNCPVGGSELMTQVASILGMDAADVDPQVAVVRCDGSCENTPRTNQYDGAINCAIANSLYGGESACSYGCLGCGDCVSVCLFDAIHINPETGLPEVDEEKCTACGACVDICPRNIIELRPMGRRSRRVYVSCMNKDRGPIARRACEVSCIGCSICVKACNFDAITIKDRLAYIDPDKCKLCRKCVEACPQNAITEVNFPPRRKRETDATKPKAGVAKAQESTTNPKKEKATVAAEPSSTKESKSDASKPEER